MNEAVRSVSNAEEAVGLIGTDIADYLNGGADKENENVELGKQHGLNAASIKTRWADARAQRATVETAKAADASDEPLTADGLVEPKAKAFFKTPDTQPRVDRYAYTGVAASTSKPDFLVNMDAPYEVARRFLVDRHSLDGIATLRWWCGEWRKWNGTHYAVMEEDALRAEIYGYLAKVNGSKFDPGPKHVNAVIDGIKARVLLSAEVEVGAWLGEDGAPWGEGAIVCCKNGVFRLSDGQIWPHDPKLFALNVIETEYRPDAQAPRWERFLDELWGQDCETRNALQEFFGLALTDETKYQKGFILVGPARSGKGTIARVLMHLLGRNNYCGPSLGQLAQAFGMQGLIGKKLAVVPDARLDNRANRSVITEKLLSIIGEDVQDINRKNKPYWSGILQLRVMILSNELPDFKDDTGVIATRFIILQTLVSFLGREDAELESKLCGELSGILNWALGGWQRLAQRGKFKPLGTGELNEELASNASVVKAFAAECCEFGAEYAVTIDAMYNSYRAYCEGNGACGWADRLPINIFSGKLRAAFPGQIDTIRPRSGGTRKRMFAGIRLRKGRSV